MSQNDRQSPPDDDHDSLIVVDGLGRPAIRGTRFRVAQLVAEWRAFGGSPAEIADRHEGVLTAEQIAAAFAWFLRNPNEIEKEMSDDAAAIESARRPVVAT